jgi:hypothetical protein
LLTIFPPTIENDIALKLFEPSLLPSLSTASTVNNIEPIPLA